MLVNGDSDPVTKPESFCRIISQAWQPPLRPGRYAVHLYFTRYTDFIYAR
jgi:hypothetical protein